MKGKNNQITKENIHKAENALKGFLDVNGFYPCPASRLEKRGKVLFGKSLDSCISDENQLFLQKMHTEILPATDTLIAEGRNKYKVRIGILPFRSLGLSDSDAVDGWGWLLQYAVTEKLTDTASFDQKAGAIDVVAEDRQSRLVPSGSVQYVIFSTGEDGKAGYSGDGVFMNPCPLNVLETENCNGDAVFMDAQLQLAQGKRRGENVVSYDDHIAYKQYDIDLAGRGGLVYFYRESCMTGFTEVEVKSRLASGIERLNKKPSFMRNQDDRSAAQKLCFSTLYSASLTLMVQGKGEGDVVACPEGWTNIGYLEGAGEGATSGQREEEVNYQVCAR